MSALEPHDLADLLRMALAEVRLKDAELRSARRVIEHMQAGPGIRDLGAIRSARVSMLRAAASLQRRAPDMARRLQHEADTLHKIARGQHGQD